jgi:methyl-accepting chemotaxis protein
MEQSLEGITTVMERDLKNTSDYSQKIIKASLERLEEQFQEIEHANQLMKNQFERTSTDANKVFRTSIDTFDNGLSKMGEIAKEWDKHLKNMKRFSTHSESAIEQLTHTSQKVIDEISTIAHTLPKAGAMLNNLDDFLSKIKERDNRS